MISLEELAVGRVVVLGVGHALRGDDAAGSVVASRLRERFSGLVFDGGQAPENYLGPVRRAAPDTVFVVDAADFSGEPGEIRVAASGQIDGAMLGTHGTPLDVVMTMIETETGAKTHLIAIQGRAVDLGGSMTREVEGAVDGLVEELSRILGARGGARKGGAS